MTPATQELGNIEVERSKPITIAHSPLPNIQPRHAQTFRRHDTTESDMHQKLTRSITFGNVGIMVLALQLSACGGGADTEFSATSNKSQPSSATLLTDGNLVTDSNTSTSGIANAIAPTDTPARQTASGASTDPFAGQSSDQRIQKIPAPVLEDAVLSANGPSIVTIQNAGTAYLPSTTFAGRGWYVDFFGGNDANAGTITQPFKSLTKANTARLAAGDAVLLKCGGIWRESITISNLNAPAGNATLGIYGNCTADTLPLVSGATYLSSAAWQLASNFAGKPVYVAKIAHPLSYVYWNRDPLIRARQPNYNGVTNELSLMAQASGSTAFKLSPSDNAALGTTDLTNATAYMRSSPWGIEAATVSSASTLTGNVNLATPTKYSLLTGQGYYLEGKISMLDMPGEWYYDEAQGLLYVWTPGGQHPASGMLEGVKRITGIAIVNSPDTKIDRIVVGETATTAIRITGSKRAIVTGAIVRNAVQDGILIDGGSAEKDSSGSRIEYATVANAGSNGIILKSPNTVISRTAIDGTGMSPLITTAHSAINAIANSVSILNNRITNSGLRAIELGAVNGGIVAGNFISNACARFTDCGAIYVYGKPDNTSPRTTIASNAIKDMTANSIGAIGGAPTLVAGIYLDEGSAYIDVTNNMISGVDTGIKIHDASFNTVSQNTVWLTGSVSLMVHSSTTTGDSVRGNVVQGNLFYAANSLVASSTPGGLPTRRVVYPQHWMHYSNASSMFSGISPNVVHNNFAGTMSSKGKVQWLMTSSTSSFVMNIQQWSLYASGDNVQHAYPAVELVATQAGQELVQNPTFSAPGTPWKVWRASTAQGTINFGTCLTGCVTFVPGNTYDALSSNTFNLNSSNGTNLYLMHFKGTGLAPTTTLYANISRTSDNASVGLSAGFGLVSFEESAYSLLFYAKGSDIARLNINGIAGQGFNLSDMGVYQVSGYKLFTPIGETALLTNESPLPATLDCAKSKLRTCVTSDLRGNAVVWPVTLAPNSSLAVVTADATWKPAR